MSMAKQCDRCNKLYMPHHVNVRNKKTKANGFIIIDRNDDNSNYYIREYVDLCPECMDTFTNWLNEFAEGKIDG